MTLGGIPGTDGTALGTLMDGIVPGGMQAGTIPGITAVGTDITTTIIITTITADIIPVVLPVVWHPVFPIEAGLLSGAEGMLLPM